MIFLMVFYVILLHMLMTLLSFSLLLIDRDYGMWQQLDMASELESELRGTVYGF